MGLMRTGTYRPIGWPQDKRATWRQVVKALALERRSSNQKRLILVQKIQGFSIPEDEDELCSAQLDSSSINIHPTHDFLHLQVLRTAATQSEDCLHPEMKSWATAWLKKNLAAV